MNVAHSYFKKIMCFEAITIFWNSWKAGMYANATSCGIFLLSFFLCIEYRISGILDVSVNNAELR